MTDRTSKASIRPIVPADLEGVIDLDRLTTGQSRRGFFEKRLDAAAREPGAFLSLGAAVDGSLVGFAFAYVLDGEFGGVAPVAVLDAVNVHPDAQGRGVGRQLMTALTQALRGRGVRELQTQADWTQYDIVHFFGAAGFTLAPRLVLERQTTASADF
ncbi:MAG: GNAT family N-acetyltransferase [Rhodospirillales bacterium]|nr:GNAT family N-acetyltransferase [Rhodospirillales bacterium]